MSDEHMRGGEANFCQQCKMPEHSGVHGPRPQSHKFQPGPCNCKLGELRAEVEKWKRESHEAARLYDNCAEIRSELRAEVERLEARIKELENRLNES